MAKVAATGTKDGPFGVGWGASPMHFLLGTDKVRGVPGPARHPKTNWGPNWAKIVYERGQDPLQNPTQK